MPEDTRLPLTTLPYDAGGQSSNWSSTSRIGELSSLPSCHLVFHNLGFYIFKGGSLSPYDCKDNLESVNHV